MRTKIIATIVVLMIGGDAALAAAPSLDGDYLLGMSTNCQQSTDFPQGKLEEDTLTAEFTPATHHAKIKGFAVFGTLDQSEPMHEQAILLNSRYSNLGGNLLISAKGTYRIYYANVVAGIATYAIFQGVEHDACAIRGTLMRTSPASP